MTGLEIIKKAIKSEPTDRIPWVPFVGVHGAHLLKMDAETYLKSADHIIQGTEKAIELYQPDGIPISFDLQIEAETLGCELSWAKDNPPAVMTHPLAGGKDISDLQIPDNMAGRIPIMMEACKKIRSKHPDIALYGLITGPFTLALHLLGTDIFMNMFDKPEYIKSLMEFTSNVGMKMSEYYIDAGCDVVAVVDPMSSQIGPDQFHEFITKPATDIFEFIRSKNKLSSFFVCGHAQQNIEAMCECKPDNVSVDENIPLDFVKDACSKHNISFGGNLQLTMVLLMGNPESCQQAALECMETGGSKGFILAPGCDLPMKTPTENLAAISKLTHDSYQQEVIRNLEKVKDQEDLLNLKDYGKADKVVIDVITLDSESCPPCQYMVEAVKRVVPLFKGLVEWREHSIKDMDSVTFMSSLFVKNIPTICIDGKISFVSRIPPKDELIRAIQNRINEKILKKLQFRKGELFILGKTEEETKEMKDLVTHAQNELGANLTVRTVLGEEKMKTFGINEGPALITANYKLRTEGETPSIEILKEWIKELML